MNIERDKFLTEAMGSIWDAEVHRARYSPYDDKYWAWFGKLWNWSQDQEWWGSKSPFWAGFTSYPSHGRYLIGDKFINPDRFADAVYDYLKERQHETARS